MIFPAKFAKGEKEKNIGHDLQDLHDLLFVFHSKHVNQVNPV
jgi:hypothetical protein